MPIEIRSLYIKAIIDTGGKKGAASPAAGPGSKAPPGEGGGGQAPDELVDLCVEKVLEVLREKSER